MIHRAVVALAALLIAVPAAADDGPLGPFELTLGSRVWVSSAHVNWNFAGDIGATRVDVLSELRWRGADALVTEISADLVWRTLILSLAFGRGDVDDGVLINDDFAQSGRRSRFSHTRSSVEGDLFYVSADVGARVLTWGEAGQGHLDLLAGYQHWHEQYEAYGLTGIFDLTPFGIPVVLPNVAPPRLKVITHDYTIHSIRVGARTRVPLAAGLALHARLFLVPWSAFEMQDRHHARPDLRQNPSFSSEAEGGFGVQVGGGVSYTWKRLSVEAGWEYWRLDSGPGDKFTHVPGLPKIRDRLNEITIERSGPYLGVHYRF